ncbi:cytochrome P450 [Melittangium boletus]|nr:cytochrome P450 [Melittangium boletus]
MEAPGGLPLLGHLPRMVRAPHEYIQSLRAHGDIVRIRVGTSPVYVVTSPELIHQVLVARSDGFERGRVFDKATAAIGKGVIVTNGDFHLRQRRLLQPGFQRARIHGYMETIHRQVDTQAARWTPGGRISLREEMHRFTLNAVTRTLFGANTEEGIATEIGDYIDAANAWVSHHTLLSSEFFERLPTPVNRAFVRKKARFDELIGAFIDARRADERDHGDLLSALLAAQDAETGKGMSDEQLRIEIAGLFVAGSETTATALSWLFHEVGKDPQVEARIQAEVDSVLGGRPVTADDLPRLQYIQCVVSETLRLYPIAWLLMRRTLRDLELGGYHLPAGVEVLVSPIMSHRNPRIYPEPMRFDPDRWLPERARELPRYALLPFGDGKHKCIGDMFARTEMVIAVAAIAARWRLVPVPGHRVWEVPRSVLRPNQVLMTTVPRTPHTPQETQS